MSDYFSMISKLDDDPEGTGHRENVISIQGASSSEWALLDAFPQKPNCYDDQLWVADPTGQMTPGGGPFYFIKSKLNPNLFITIKGAVGTGAKLEMAPKTGNDNQIWDFSTPVNQPQPVESPYSYYYIESKQSPGLVITITTPSHRAGQLLEMAPMTGNDNQFWVDG